jgi:hypothetical protein
MGQKGCAVTETFKEEAQEIVARELNHKGIAYIESMKGRMKKTSKLSGGKTK